MLAARAGVKEVNGENSLTHRGNLGREEGRRATEPLSPAPPSYLGISGTNLAPPKT